MNWAKVMKFVKLSPQQLASQRFTSPRLSSMLLGLYVLLTASLSYADVTITAPEEIEVIAINGQEVQDGFLSYKENSFQLDAGTHNIAVRYKDLFNLDPIRHDILKSGIVSLNQVQLQDGQNYRITLVNAPSDYDEAKKFAKKPTIGVENAQGQLIAKQAGANSKSTSWFGNSIFGSSVDLRSQNDAPKKISTQSAMLNTQAAKNTTSMAQTVGAVTTTTVQAPLAQAQSTGQLQTTGKAQQLIQLWQSATPQERQKFTAWLAEQAANQ